MGNFKNSEAILWDAYIAAIGAKRHYCLQDNCD
jgi:hypothetical protein